MSKTFCITNTGVIVNNIPYPPAPSSPINITISPTSTMFNSTVVPIQLNYDDIIKNCTNQTLSFLYNGIPITNQLNPNDYYVYYNDGSESVSQFIYNKAPQQQEAKKIKVCFTFETMQKLIPIIESDTKDYQIIKSKKGDTKIIRAEHKELGILEFTENHPFYYDSKIITFDELVKVNPNFISYEISSENICYVYNVYKNTNNEFENYFKLSNDLIMIGARKGIDGIFGCFFNMKGELSHQLNSNKKIIVTTA
jgi:hypothetical protein